MTVYEAAQEVRKHFATSVSSNTVHTTAILGICKGEILKFESRNQAELLNGNNGYLFECRYDHGHIEVKPIG
jgi:hypothetical protein